MKYLYFLSIFAILPTSASAQEFRDPCGGSKCGEVTFGPPITDDQITVVATGSRDMIDSTGQPVSVITANEIEKIQGPDLTRVLERLPGVTWTRNGPLGSTTGLFVRGANSEQLLVLIDGVRMEDVAAPSGGFDLGTLMAGGIGKIELLRGSNSVPWGSAAIGGVLAISSDTRPGLHGSIEYGAHDSLSTGLGARIGDTQSFLGFNGGYTRSDGISAFAAGIEPDGFRQWSLGGNGRVGMGERFALVGTARYADSRVGFDGFPPPIYQFADTPEYQTSRQASGRTGVEYRSQALTLDAGLALSDTRRSYFDPGFGTASTFDTIGHSLRADVTGRTELTDALQLDFGADSEWTRFSTSFDSRRNARLASGHAQLGYHAGRALNLTAGLRYDDHNRFGGHWSLGADGALWLGDGWRLHGAWGQGFKAPTLYQLYGFGGNAALRPESSDSFDLGIERGDRNAPLHLGLSLFRRDSRNLISYVWPTGYFNTARVRAQGAELELAARLGPKVTASAAWSYVEATDRDSGLSLARRPRHAVTTSLDWTTPLVGLALGADLRLVGDSFDDAANTRQLDGHALATLRASIPLGNRFELFGRIENLFDQSYAVAADYGTYGRAAYAGVRLRW